MTEGPEWADLVRDLEEGDDEERRYAAQDLEDLGSPDAVPHLVKALHDPVVSVREAVVDALAAIGGREVCEAMASLLDAEEAPIRNAATEVLQRLHEEAIDTCVRLLESPSHDVRKIAVDILGATYEVRESPAFEKVIQALEDPHINVAIAACEALGRLGGNNAVEALHSHLGRHPGMDAAIFLALAQIGGDRAKEVVESIDPVQLEGESLLGYKAARDMMRRVSPKMEGAS